MKKWILFSLWLALVGVQAQAQGLKVWINDAVITADGETKTMLTVYQTDPTDDQYVAFQMKLHVPKGIHIAQKKQGRVYVDDLTLNAERFEGLGHSLSGNMPDERTIVLSCVDMGNNPFYPDDADGNTVEELFTIGLVADNTMTNGVYTISLSGVDFIHSDGSSNSPEEEVSFKLTVTGGQEPVETPISYILSEAGVGTLILPYDAALPEGLKAYKCVSLQENTVVLEEQPGIAAHTPVLLQGKPGTYTFTGMPQGGDASYTSGLLTGVMEATEITTGYVLQTQSGVTGFYAVTPEKPVTVPVYHCYLEVEAGVRMLSVLFPDGVTGIKSLLISPEEGPVYNVAGQRITKTSKGINIREGKKIVVK
jgi:hypothetical protein